eukprot:14440460-Alexandrium_andersonii.AAC.1
MEHRGGRVSQLGAAFCMAAQARASEASSLRSTPPPASTMRADATPFVPEGVHPGPAATTPSAWRSMRPSPAPPPTPPASRPTA